MSEPIGVIAGESILPVLSIQEARRQGRPTIVAAIRGGYLPELRDAADIFAEFSLSQIGKAVRFFQNNGVKQAIMVGRVRHPAIFDMVKADWAFLGLLTKARSRTTTNLLLMVIDFFRENSIEFVDSTLFLQPLLVQQKGYPLMSRAGSKLATDIDFGWEKAWGIAALDIGQTVCVKGKAVIAVEAMEGTDRTIERAAQIAGSGVVVVKVSRPGNEMRFDVPVIGAQTVDLLIRVKAAALVVQADHTLMLDQEYCIHRARPAKLVIMGKS